MTRMFATVAAALVLAWPAAGVAGGPPATVPTGQVAPRSGHVGQLAQWVGVLHGGRTGTVPTCVFGCTR